MINVQSAVENLETQLKTNDVKGQQEAAEALLQLLVQGASEWRRARGKIHLEAVHGIVNHIAMSWAIKELLSKKASLGAFGVLKLPEELNQLMEGRVDPREYLSKYKLRSLDTMTNQFSNLVENTGGLE